MILKNNKTIDEEKEKGLLSEQEAKILIVDDEKDTTPWQPVKARRM